MGNEIIYYAIYFFLTLVLSTLFAMGGVGSAIALVPVLHFFGLEFNLSKAIGLFVNTSTTVTATIMNLKRKVLDIKFAFPLAISLAFAAPIGAYFSKIVPESFVKIIFIAFLFFAGSMLLFGRKEQKFHYVKIWVLIVLGSIVGVISGLLGVGGGSLLMPILILLGFDAKKVAIAMSFVIPFSTFSAFLTYLSFVEIDWLLLFIVTIAAILGGYIGNYIMHFHLNQKHIKKIIGFLLYLIGIKMIFRLV
ncbi:sulfite exporter TauE/SafE family protein [Nitrosophilus kaiyonis]|uniref:sulfite exporter TauE/SafE family protein n=1 Tax=Nitrosophilus kaiyonis TaxID=2930200 RepID=UPI002490F496|nr:sulfite exporter TauE/SafE family protein [Nitrosophilus kaiyonis]